MSTSDEKSLQDAVTQLEEDGHHPLPFDVEAVQEDTTLGFNSTIPLKQELRIPRIPQLVQLANQMVEIGAAVKQISHVVGRLIYENRESIENAKNILGKIASIPWREIIDRQAEALLFAGRNGWFIQPETTLPQLSEIAELALDDNVQGLDDVMTLMIRSSLDEIEQLVIEAYPDRAEIVVEAFRLHREGRYIAAIPLFIIQAEGIGLQETEYSAFNTGKNRPEIARHIDSRFVNQSDLIFARPLANNHPLSRPIKGKLNRHRVLHGNDVSYGSEINSLQAISFLGNIAWILSQDRSLPEQ